MSKTTTSSPQPIDYRNVGQRIKCSRCSGKIHETRIVPPGNVIIACHKCGDKILVVSARQEPPKMVTDIAKQVGPGGSHE